MKRAILAAIPVLLAPTFLLASEHINGFDSLALNTQSLRVRVHKTKHQKSDNYSDERTQVVKNKTTIVAMVPAGK